MKTFWFTLGFAAMFFAFIISQTVIEKRELKVMCDAEHMDYLIISGKNFCVDSDNRLIYKR